LSAIDILNSADEVNDARLASAIRVCISVVLSRMTASVSVLEEYLGSQKKFLKSGKPVVQFEQLTPPDASVGADDPQASQRRVGVLFSSWLTARLSPL
jgi:hypothetical protein